MVIQLIATVLSMCKGDQLSQSGITEYTKDHLNGHFVLK